MSAMPKYAMTYVVYWPEHGVLKVGRAWKFHRVQLMVRTGAEVLILARGTDATWEREALHILDRWFPRAFERAWESEGLLFMGRGWTECYRVDEHYLQLAVDLIFKGFARGNDQGVNEATNDQRSRPAHAGVPACAGDGEADSDGALAPHGRVRPAEAGAGADRGRPLPGPGGDRDGGRAPADARRGGLPLDLPGRGLGVDRAVEAAAGGHARSGLGVPAAGLPWTPMDVRGCGGRGRAGARERARASAGACGRVGASGGARAGERMGRVGVRAREGDPTTPPAAAHGCPTDRLPRPSTRPLRGLRTLRHGSPPPRPLGRRAALHRTPERLRRRDRRRSAVPRRRVTGKPSTGRKAVPT